MAISEENDRLTIIISKKMKNELKELAELENRSLSNYVVNVLEDHLERGSQSKLKGAKEVYELMKAMEKIYGHDNTEEALNMVAEDLTEYDKHKNSNQENNKLTDNNKRVIHIGN